MSSDAPPFDVSHAHRHFSVYCFNEAWALIDKPARTAGDDEAMELAALASLWHWARRPDCTDLNRSISHWQVSRVYALLGRAADAVRHADRCMAYSGGLPPFYLGYAHEASARAALAAGDAGRCREHLERARHCAAEVAEADERDLLERDLRDLEQALGPQPSPAGAAG
jgi:hypothetical protein